MLSIVIPVYNRRELLEETLNSVRQQKRADWECILVDDHSTDGADETAQEYAAKDPRFRWYRRPEGLVRGPSSCRNEGLRRAAGDVIFFMDSDDVIDPDFWKIFGGILDRYPKLDFLSIRFGRFHRDPKHCYRYSPKKPRHLSTVESLAGGKISHATHSFLWRKTFLSDCQVSWPPGLTVYEDLVFAFHAAACSSNNKAVSLPILYYYRKHRSELRRDSGRSEKQLEMSVQAFEILVQICERKECSLKTRELLAGRLRKAMWKCSGSRNRELIDRLNELKKRLNVSTWSFSEMLLFLSKMRF
ncbi:MAG: glycosyltransferase family 2 protein [Thermoguttaceae bacterium]|nr:glycosyltransferase family 2 protein [Thermoguttaceae bacterium]